ncbi:hypothetical protein [Variovorax sp. YR216]|uniref:hypothetical protein n=1 Tax=Variovorax sp. YR216 TaxID=1882828 RepID=UPI00089BDAD4|nr:hypothetical protein [Variovorax sp. YR216]SEB21705.1 hypothetical protein SAMN05444680_11512 [Variovorax sp. YR216]
MTEPTLPKDEYAALHDEATACMAELASLERGCIVSAAIVFAWVATNSQSLVGFSGLVWAVPVAIAVLGSLKALAVGRHISALGRSLKELEVQVQGDGDRGARQFGRRWRARRWASAAAWLLFIGLTVIGSTLGYLQFRTECPGPLVNACGKDDGGDDNDQQEPSLKPGSLPSGTRWLAG